jgi:hypothetical protein
MNFFEDITNFVHNATTGELTDNQKAAIAADSLSSYIPCQGDNATSPACLALLTQYQKDVNTVAPSTGCVMNVPVFGCLAHSWNNLAFVVLVSIAGVFFLWTAILTSPKRRF